MKKIFILGTALYFLAIYLISCTGSSTDSNIAGNGTRIGNPSIVGMIYKPDGKTPAPNATVFLRKKNSLPEIGLKKQASDIAIVTTGNDGRFEIDSVANGTYVIECNDMDDNYALYDSVGVENNDSTVNLPADTLKPAGVISGTITLPEGGDFSRVYVLVFGVQRFSIVDSNGNFYLDNLAEGNYNLRIISTLEYYENLDTMMIPVLSAETTKLAIEQPFAGVPTAKNLILVRYDTLSHAVTLSWNKIDPSRILGYNVYRKEMYALSERLFLGLDNDDPEIGSLSFSKVNYTPITDTIFNDLTAYQNEKCTYAVTVVSKDLKESSISNEISVTIATRFSADTLFHKDFGNFSEEKGCNPNKLLYKNGTFYIASHYGVRLYDTLFNQTGILDNFPRRPFEIAADNNGRIYVSVLNSANTVEYYTHSISSIYIFNQNIIAKRLNLNDTLDSIPALGFEASLFTVLKNGNIIFVNKTQDSLFICDTIGSTIRKVGGFAKGSKGISTLATDRNNNIFLYEEDKGISIYNDDGVKLRSFDTKFHSLKSKIDIDPRNGNIYFCVSGRLTVFSPEGQFITVYNLITDGQHIILTDNKIYVALPGLFNYYENTWTIATEGSVLKLTNNLP
jgi:hypothetical protein